MLPPNSCSLAKQEGRERGTTMPGLPAPLCFHSSPSHNRGKGRHLKTNPLLTEAHCNVQQQGMGRSFNAFPFFYRSACTGEIRTRKKRGALVVRFCGLNALNAPPWEIAGNGYVGIELGTFCMQSRGATTEPQPFTKDIRLGIQNPDRSFSVYPT